MPAGRRMELEEWIADANRDEEKGVLRAVKVHHLLTDGETGRLTLGDEVVGRVIQVGVPWKSKDLADLIIGKCRVYAQDLPGVQTFKVMAYYRDSQDPGATHHITQTGRTLVDEGGTEPATARGAMAQSMRVNDAIVSRVMSMHDRLWTISEALMARHEAESQYWHREARDGEAIIHQLMRERITENNAHAMRLAEYERGTAERQKLITFLPALLRHITRDQNILPADLEDSAIMRSVALAIRKMDDATKQSTMTEILKISPELAMVLGARLQEIIKEQEKEDAAARMVAEARASDATEDQKELVKEILSGRAGLGLGDGSGGE